MIHNNDKFCYIFGAGPILTPLQFMPQNGHDFIIAADAGYVFLQNNNIKPDILVGDLDSLGQQYAAALPESMPIIRFPTVKDDTDMMLAIKEGISRGYQNFIIYGGMGGKLEFTLANFQILYNIVNQNFKCYFLDSNNIITAIKNNKVEFDENFQGRISVFACSGAAKGVNINGLKYELKNGVLTYDTPLGVSNEFIGSSGSISVEDGMLCIIYNSNNGKLL